MKEEKRPLLSVVTVCYNAARDLEETIASVRGQNFDKEKLEYLIIDGASKDDTLEVIRRNSDVVSRFVSEPDNGLYYAMNKGLDMASGDYVLFLNAGDVFYENSTLEKVFASAPIPQDIYYGDTMILSPEGTQVGHRRLRPPKRLTAKSFRWGMTVCHQSVIIRRALCSPYDTRYSITADYDWVLSCIERADKGRICNTHLFVSAFRQGGISSRNVFRANRQRFLIMMRHYGLVPTLWFNCLMLFRLAYTYLKLGRM